MIIQTAYLDLHDEHVEQQGEDDVKHYVGNQPVGVTRFGELQLGVDLIDDGQFAFELTLVLPLRINLLLVIPLCIIFVLRLGFLFLGQAVLLNTLILSVMRVDEESRLKRVVVRYLGLLLGMLGLTDVLLFGLVVYGGQNFALRELDFLDVVHLVAGGRGVDGLLQGLHDEVDLRLGQVAFLLELGDLVVQGVLVVLAGWGLLRDELGLEVQLEDVLLGGSSVEVGDVQEELGVGHQLVLPQPGQVDLEVRDVLLDLVLEQLHFHDPALLLQIAKRK